MQKQDLAGHKTITRLSKYLEDIAPFKEGRREAEFHKLFNPYEVKEIEDNILLNVGCDALWARLIADNTETLFSEALTYIGVGDSTVATDASQTDLQATENSQYNAMEAGFPTSGTQKATFKSSFGDTEANFAWNEWVVKQTAGVCLNRKVESLGTKTTGTWTLEVAITLS